jgi:hypothetical protein
MGTEARDKRELGSTYVCEEGRRLLDLFGAAVQELVVLHERQFLAVVEGDPDANRFDLLIHEANEKKQAAKYIYMTHMEAHRCSWNDEIDIR